VYRPTRVLRSFLLSNKSSFVLFFESTFKVLFALACIGTYFSANPNNRHSVIRIMSLPAQKCLYEYKTQTSKSFCAFY